MKEIVKNLINEQTATIDMIYQLKELIAKEEMTKEELECKLWVETDFAKLKLSNADQRKAYVRKEMSKINNNIANLKNDLLYAENQLKILKTKEKMMLEFGLDIFEEE